MRRNIRKARPVVTEKKFRANHEIRVPEVFVIDESGERLGVFTISKALAMAEENGLDLIEVNPKGEPPVVKLMDFGQFRYKLDKQAQKQKSKQKKVEIKGIRLSVRISQHDFDMRIDQARKFLIRGDKLKVELMLRGREKQHPDKAAEVDKLKQSEGFAIAAEQPLTRQGGTFNIILFNKLVV
jgi:translation initiation factor IF-3